MDLELYRHIEAAALCYQAELEARLLGIFPYGMCFLASLELAPRLRQEVGLELVVVKGVVADCQHHAWIELPDGAVIDPTYGQFDRGAALRILHPRVADQFGHCAEIPLGPADEDHFRNSIDTAGPIEHRGWKPGCGIHELFSEWPRLPASLNVVGA